MFLTFPGEVASQVRDWMKLLSCPHCPHCSPGWGLWLAVWKWPYWAWHGLLSSLRSKSPADCTLFFTISLWRIGTFQEVSVIRRRWVRSDSSWANRKAQSVWPQGCGQTEGNRLSEWWAFPLCCFLLNEGSQFIWLIYQVKIRWTGSQGCIWSGQPGPRCQLCLEVHFPNQSSLFSNLRPCFLFTCLFLYGQVSLFMNLENLIF